MEDNGNLTGGNGRRQRNRRQAEIIPLRQITGETRGEPYDRERIQRAAARDKGENRKGTPVDSKEAATKGKGRGNRGVTAKEDAFARLVAEGKTLSDAYRQAYDVRPETKPETIWTAGYKLSEKSHVAQRINWHLERIEREKPHDDAATRRLVRDYLVGVVQDTAAKTSDRTRAAELLGKVGGVALFSEQKANSTAKPRSKEELEAALEALLQTVRGETLDKTGT